MKIINIGDVHLNVRDNRDDFYYKGLTREQREAKVKRLINLIMREDVDVFVFGGDFMDGVESSNTKIIEMNWFIFETIDEMRLRGKKFFFLTGNHDKCETMPYHCINILELGNHVFIHGHQLDMYFTKYSFIGMAIMKLCGYLEQKGWRDVDIVFKFLNRGRYGSNKDYYKKIEKWVARNPQYKDKIIHFHHTHEQQAQPVQLRNCKVVNAGTCIHDRWGVLEFVV